ncbi:CHAP domain-containing protein [Streptococcus pasteurianus]|nr:CHAP domain-containing protein [Streptococcus pasteurianus]
MATVTELLNYAKSLTGSKVTVSTNPYGGQCVAFVDHLTQWETGGKYNLAYTNAIDLLSKARANGFEVFYWNGSNAPQAGDIWVTRTYSHAYGHTGIFTTNGGQPQTLEQNVDGNSDALTNGGWVRQKQRLLYSDGTMNYNPYIEKQTLIGWFRLPLDKESTATTSTIKKGHKTGMYGSFFYHLSSTTR